MEFHGPTKNQLAEVLEMVHEICKGEGCSEFRPALGRGERDRLLKARHELGEMIIRNHPDSGVLSIDVAVPITGYPEIVWSAHEEMATTGLVGYTFGHAGDGNVHLVIAGKRGDKREWELIDQVSNRMVSKALSLGGTATGEHGVGIGKRQFMEAEHGKSLEWMRRVKSLFDPNGILNPGKIFP
jgi:D-lactate dehydrogenase (cytochrome)